MSKKDITSLRGTLDYLREKNQILVSGKEVDVNYDAHLGMRLVIIVDEDIDIYCTEDVFWAIMTRSNPDIDFVKGIGGATGTAAMPTERQEVRGQGGHTGTLGIDATVPIQEREHFSRSGYPVDLVKLEEWFEKSDIAEALSHQPEYAQVLARIGG